MSSSRYSLQSFIVLKKNNKRIFTAIGARYPSSDLNYCQFERSREPHAAKEKLRIIVSSNRFENHCEFERSREPYVAKEKLQIIVSSNRVENHLSHLRIIYNNS